jgi:hypothetical protein
VPVDYSVMIARQLCRVSGWGGMEPWIEPGCTPSTADSVSIWLSADLFDLLREVAECHRHSRKRFGVLATWRW